MSTSTAAPPRRPDGQPPGKRKPDSRTSGEGRMAALLLSPTLLVLALVIAYPLVSALYQSLFREESGLDENGFVAEGETFVGLANYTDLLVGESGERFLNALANTTFFTLTTVTLETVLGLCLALAMNRAFRGRGLLRASILIPWAVPTAVSGLLWRWIFQSDGIANTLIGTEILWTAEGFQAKAAVIIAEVWKTAPFIGLLVLAGMQVIPEEVYEAARIDGAGWWRTLGSITLPLVKPTLLVAVLFRLLDALRMFDLPFVLIGPGKQSVETLSMLAWDESNQLRYGSASAFAVVLFLYVALVAIVFVKLLGADVAGAKEMRSLRKTGRSRKAKAL
ncbi:carbohydrate ABC transporter permease [Arthrobacter sp. zg-Y1110]|uniref:carbohydrate ABC transporter permease n=1 Tax=Arthrobacter sp. zg-Y1110 TaxID=2886932 RepID=UPI001D14749F|nr:sugar ABC transporter permease [Arthrobacter sp. zg-Y1110]MCC3289813.1 sugar ABC transporter permease [Arthrobacter sp. zg-Y1110]UWX84770.1 sugar ABC transporter permease [Arthrobacter sp. zg-Y1110]